MENLITTRRRRRTKTTTTRITTFVALGDTYPGLKIYDALVTASAFVTFDTFRTEQTGIDRQKTYHRVGRAAAYMHAATNLIDAVLPFAAVHLANVSFTRRIALLQ